MVYEAEAAWRAQAEREKSEDREAEGEWSREWASNRVDNAKGNLPPRATSTWTAPPPPPPPSEVPTSPTSPMGRWMPHRSSDEVVVGMNREPAVEREGSRHGHRVAMTDEEEDEALREALRSAFHC